MEAGIIIYHHNQYENLKKKKNGNSPFTSTWESQQRNIIQTLHMAKHSYCQQKPKQADFNSLDIRMPYLIPLTTNQTQWKQGFSST